jgi:hypothetical protein
MKVFIELQNHTDLANPSSPSPTALITALVASIADDDQDILADFEVTSVRVTDRTLD